MFRFWCQRNCKSFEGVPVPRCFRSVGPLPVSTCYAIHSNVTSILFRDTLNVTYLQTSRDLRRVHAVSAPQLRAQKPPKWLQLWRIKSCEQGLNIQTGKLQSGQRLKWCWSRLCRHPLTRFSRIKAWNQVNKTISGNLVSMHQDRNVELAAVESGLLTVAGCLLVAIKTRLRRGVVVVLCSTQSMICNNVNYIALYSDTPGCTSCNR